MQAANNDEYLEQFLTHALTSQLVTADYSITKYPPEIREADGQKYNYNNEGHRGPDFAKNVDMLAIGCSVTYGTGLPIESTWSYKLAKDLGLSYNLLAFPGGGISLLVRQVFQYIDKYGAPKYLVALLPDNDRVDVYGLSDRANFKHSNKKRVEEKIRSISLSGLTSDNSIISHKERSVNIKYARLNAMSQTVMLIKLCKLLGINLLWGTWSDWDIFADLSYDFYSVGGDILQTRSTVSDIRPGGLVHALCHEDPNDPYWVEGSDEVKHWGTHYHVHVVEHFKQEIENLYGTKS